MMRLWSAQDRTFEDDEDQVHPSLGFGYETSGEIRMNAHPTTFTIVLSGPPLTTGTFAQSAKAVGGTDTYGAPENEPAPGLTVDAPVPEALAAGAVQIKYRAEDVQILSAFGTGDLNISQRVGHLHIAVDDLPVYWADANDNGSIEIVGLLPGEHTVLIELADNDHKISPGQSAHITFTAPSVSPHSG